MSDREPPSPLARNLFAMRLPADIAALIEPPNRIADDEEDGFDRFSYRTFQTFNLNLRLSQAHVCPGAKGGCHVRPNGV